MKNNKKTKKLRMLKRLIMFLIRIRLGVKKNEKFKFTNQKDTCFYTINETGFYKNVWKDEERQIFKPYYYITKLSHLKINWLLSEECQTRRIEG